MNDQEIERLKKSTSDAIDAANAAAVQVVHHDGVANGWDKNAVLILSIAILIFGLITLGCIAFILLRHPVSLITIQFFALPLIIVSAIFLVVTGYSQEQIAPVIGLLGTIAGYLLGRSDRTTLTSDSRSVPPPAVPPTG